MSLEAAKRLVGRLEQKGYSAFLVGGCVRDLLLGQTPKDFDIATSAKPDEVKQALSSCRFADTGIEHGTVMAITGGEGYEITTFRTESGYSDHRRPDRVEFVSSIEQDLVRRDFTINAMAMSQSGEIIDLYGGKEDIKNRLIRCVGDPAARFTEDPLRILRAVRFYSRLGFSVEQNTRTAAVELANMLDDVARERISAELAGVMLGDNVFNALMDFRPIIFKLIPELKPCDNFEQKNPWHLYSAYEHTARVVAACRPVLALRLSALLHDVAKPECFFITEEGRGHFYGHAEKGAPIATDILRRLRFDSVTVKRVERLVRHHSADIAPTEKAARRWISRLGAEEYMLLIELKTADDTAKNPEKAAESLETDRQLFEIAKRVIEAGGCLGIHDLSISGSELIALGLRQGKGVGDILNKLFLCVASGELPNEREALLQRAKSLIEREI